MTNMKEEKWGNWIGIHNVHYCCFWSRMQHSYAYDWHENAYSRSSNEHNTMCCARWVTSSPVSFNLFFLILVHFIFAVYSSNKGPIINYFSDFYSSLIFFFFPIARTPIANALFCSDFSSISFLLVRLTFLFSSFFHLVSHFMRIRCFSLM